MLFFPPNVSGWPTGTEWIDSSSLTFRLSLPALLFSQAEPNIEWKDDGDVNNVTHTTGARRLTMRVDWSLLDGKFASSETAATLDRIEQYLLARPTRETNRKLIRDFTRSASTEGELVSAEFNGFMSLPDYQMSQIKL